MDTDLALDLRKLTRSALSSRNFALRFQVGLENYLFESTEFDDYSGTD